MRADIYGAMRNALLRGATIEQAAQSLINSGYNPYEVKEVADYISGSINSSLRQPSQMPQRQQPAQQFQQPQMQRPQQYRQVPQQPIMQPKLQQMQTAQPAYIQRPLSQIQPKQLSVSPSYQLPAQQQQTMQKPVAKSKTDGKIIFLSFTLLILIGLLVATLIFREKIIDYLKGFF